MHKEQQEFCGGVKKLFPQFFNTQLVIDFGSLDINGSNRYLFRNCAYVGVDLHEGKNVHAVSKAHEYIPVRPPDTIISTEMLEHDVHWIESVSHMIDILRDGGLLIITCATTGREEHGTWKNHPRDSPFTLDYYENISLTDFRYVVNTRMSQYSLGIVDGDLQYWGIK